MKDIVRRLRRLEARNRKEARLTGRDVAARAHWAELVASASGERCDPESLGLVGWGGRRWSETTWVDLVRSAQ